MEPLRAKLVQELERIPGLESRPSPVAGGWALFFYDKEFAHFHDEHELDLRLTKKLIKREGLAHPQDSKHHPQRSSGSQWIELRFKTSADVARVVKLVQLAVEEL